MKKSKKVGWQKYEDILESQMKSPLMSPLLEAMVKAAQGDEDNADHNDGEILETSDTVSIPFVTMSKEMEDEIAITTNFECWVGHTNFNITNTIKETLDKTDGVEVLKIYSRYRFFIGVGKMFDFSDVRKAIEKSIIKES